MERGARTHTHMRLALVITACSLGAADAAGSWTPRSLARYLRVRRGRRGGSGVVWHGEGTLRNTVNGEHIASVEGVELVRPLPSAGGAFSSERVLLYRDPYNGTLLTLFKNRRVQPLRYKLHVRMSLEDGALRLVANEPNGREVASALTDGTGPSRPGLLGRGYELFMRVPVGQTARAKRNKKTAAIGSREEYRVREAGPLGLRSSLSYRRTGRCPSWYGPGTCTLEMYSRRQWSWAFWRRRGEPPACWRRCVDEAEAATSAD